MIIVMQKHENASRRKFLKQSTLGIGAGVVSLPAFGSRTPKNKLPREVTLVSIDLVGLWPHQTTESRIKRMMERMEDIAGLQPDVVCLPELFDTIWVREMSGMPPMRWRPTS